MIILVLQVHRLVIVSNDNILDGIISLSDILTFLLQEDQPIGSMMSATSCAAAINADFTPTDRNTTIEAAG